MPQINTHFSANMFLLCECVCVCAGVCGCASSFAHTPPSVWVSVVQIKWHQQARTILYLCKFFFRYISAAQLKIGM